MVENVIFERKRICVSSNTYDAKIKNKIKAVKAAVRVARKGRQERREEGRQEGELFGIKKGKMELVKSLLNDGTLSPKKIAEISGIPLEIVNELKNDNII